MNCEICGKEAEITLSPDLDVDGLRVCADHLELMKELCLILLFLGEDEYQYTLRLYKKRLQKNKKSKI